jgi:hypothetical protein
MPKTNNAITLRIDRRELATILAALRFHQDENLQGSQGIADQAIQEIATDDGHFKPLTFQEVGQLCERLNTDDGSQFTKGLVIEPPHSERGDEPLYRVVYVIDANAKDPREAAEQVHRIMMDMVRHDSQAPVLEVIDHKGRSLSIDLSEEQPA